MPIEAGEGVRARVPRPSGRIQSGTVRRHQKAPRHAAESLRLGDSALPILAIVYPPLAAAGRINGGLAPPQRSDLASGNNRCDWSRLLECGLRPDKAP